MNFKGKKLSDFLTDICHSGAGLSREDVVAILSGAFQSAWKMNYGESEVKVILDSAGVSFYRVLSEDKVENVPLSKLSQKCVSDIYDFFEKGLTKHQKYQEYLNFKDLEGKIVNCTLVTRTVSGYLVKVNGSAQGLLDRVYNEKFIDRGSFPCLLYSVQNNIHGHQLFLDRKSNDFIKALLASIIPDIEKGVVLVRSIARIFGFECLVAVEGFASNPVGACLGYKGDRRKLVVDALNGEKVRFVQWNDDVKSMIKNCFPPGKIQDIVERDGRYFVVVENNDIAEVIGTRGNKVKLCKYLLNGATYADGNARNVDIQICRKHELESGGMNSFEKLADAIVKEKIELKSQIVSLLNSNNGDIEAILSNMFLDEQILSLVKSYYENEVFPVERSRFVELGGEERMFMYIPGLSMEFYFILLKAGIKTLKELYELSVVDLSNISHLSMESCKKVLDYMYKNYK